MKPRENHETWSKTKIQNLVRHKSGTYYARLYKGGKEQWKSLKTPLFDVAKFRLRDMRGKSLKPGPPVQRRPSAK